MSFLSPRFLALPLIALTVIVMLPRQPNASADQATARAGVVKAATCASQNAAAGCVLAVSTHSLVR